MLSCVTPISETCTIHQAYSLDPRVQTHSSSSSMDTTCYHGYPIVAYTTTACQMNTSPLFLSYTCRMLHTHHKMHMASASNTEGNYPIETSLLHFLFRSPPATWKAPSRSHFYTISTLLKRVCFIHLPNLLAIWIMILCLVTTFNKPMPCYSSWQHYVQLCLIQCLLVKSRGSIEILSWSL